MTSTAPRCAAVDAYAFLPNAGAADETAHMVAHRESWHRKMSCGMPAGIWLTKFGQIIEDYFGEIAYQVGSSLTTKDWRDVDVRLILADDEFERRFGTVRSTEANSKLAAVTLAFCALGREMTGLPIDFQIQPMSWANEKYPGNRSALIVISDGTD